MRLKKVNGVITFRFDLSDDLQRKIYEDLLYYKAPVRSHLIIEILKKNYFKLNEDRVSILENRLLDILENLSEGSIQKKVVQIQATSEQIPPIQNQTKIDKNMKLDLSNFSSTPEVEDKNKYESMLEKVYKNSFQ